MLSRRASCRPGKLRRGCVRLPALAAALWWLSGRLLLLGAPGAGHGDHPAAATHCVRTGDTIMRLCWQYKVRAEAIRAANPGVGDPLPVGRKLTIPLGRFDSARPIATATDRTPRASIRPAPQSKKTPPRPAATTRLPPPPPDAPVPVRRPDAAAPS